MTVPNSSRQGGFTLVELAIVLMIIGLLVGAILKGKEMLAHARLQATIRQINAYSAAVTTFRNEFDSWPGDMRAAQQRIPNCTTANNCFNGNGNNRIGTPDFVWNGGQQSINDENTQFWKHLADAHLISGISVNAGTPEWGVTHPVSVSPMPGGFTVMQSQDAGVASVFQGALVLRLHGSLTDPNVETDPSVSPREAGYLDNKMDDGNPQAGDVQSRAYGNGAVVADCEATYNDQRDDPFCVMSFLLNK
jgi:prepilin-type N-terminal cleavage/methylation domain-containing protein